ncbi:MAG TPA: PhaM family polyhydroxyalkanoate granule multifunctional regulatory protein [Burkholderiaceae bacterium]|nr:PhaM family polyhydroxyalkanoate granule multifunctional regulatory protein [Burkholderiaceae bacterium]
MSDTPAFPKLVPGFDFLQDLVKNAGAALPGIGSWIAPTIDPAELEKRIEELRTVQFWLEQNARMLGATIQALEVQRMTLSTLKTMNVQMEDLRDSLQLRMPTAAAPAAAPAPAPAPAPAAEREPASAPEPAASAAAPADAAPKPGVVDPMQWWGALTKQFTELATSAMKDTATDAARKMGGALLKRSLDGAPEAAPAPAAHAKPKKARAPAKKKARKTTAKTAAPRADAPRR